MTKLCHEGSAPERAINLGEWIIKSLNTTHAISSLLHIYQVWFQNIIVTTTEITVRCKILLQCFHFISTVEPPMNSFFLFFGVNLFLILENTFKPFHQVVTIPTSLFLLVSNALIRIILFPSFVCFFLSLHSARSLTFLYPFAIKSIRKATI